MKLKIDDKEIDVEDIKSIDVNINQVVVIRIPNLSMIKQEVLTMIRNNLNMLFSPARVLMLDKNCEIDVIESKE